MDIDYEKTFGFKPGSIGNRYRHHWVITEPDEDDERAGAKAGFLCVRARDGAFNPVDPDACKHPNFVGTTEDGFDTTYRYYYYRPLTDADREDPAATIAALRKRVEELEGALEPFAKAGEQLPDDRVITEGHPEWQRCLRRFKITVSELTVRQFHRARAALRAKGGSDE